ncbi:SDR family oxidoreductase, partial [Kitasatospora sp. NPDC050543]|uniref:SDR family oxidoreductase n=1 Tax=Kitasatospora sp. NPDC050543 TaxID=3364054 RepID=UPI00379E6CFF
MPGTGRPAVSHIPSPATYGIVKAALNALTLVVSASVSSSVEVNAVCPGWVRTDLGGAAAPLPVEQGADTVVWPAPAPGRRPVGRLPPQPPADPLVTRLHPGRYPAGGGGGAGAPPPPPQPPPGPPPPGGPPPPRGGAGRGGGGGGGAGARG